MSADLKYLFTRHAPSAKRYDGLVEEIKTMKTDAEIVKAATRDGAVYGQSITIQTMSTVELERAAELAKGTALGTRCQAEMTRRLASRQALFRRIGA